MVSKSSIRFSYFPKTEPPKDFIYEVVDAFKNNESRISTIDLKKGLKSDDVLSIIKNDMIKLGFDVEASKKKIDKIERPVFFGENGIQTVKYEIDAYHKTLNCGLEVEAGRAWLGNAVYRDLIIASLLSGLEHFIIAVSNQYKYKSNAQNLISKDYKNTCNLADTLFSHTRLKLPYSLTIIGY